MKKAIAISVVATANVRAASQLAGLQRSFVQTNNAVHTFAQVRQDSASVSDVATPGKSVTGNLDPDSANVDPDAPDTAEEVRVDIQAFDDVDGPIGDDPPQEEEKEEEKPAPIPADLPDDIPEAVAAAIPYDMEEPEENVSKIPDLGQMDDSTPDQDDPDAPETTVHPEINEDAGKDSDEDNTDSIVADTSEQDAQQEADLESEEPTFFPHHEQEHSVNTFVPIPVSEGNAPTIVEEEPAPQPDITPIVVEAPQEPPLEVVPENEGTPIIVEEPEELEPVEPEPVPETKPSEDLQRALDALDGKQPDVHDFVPIPTPNTMTVPPPPPVEEIPEPTPEPVEEPEPEYEEPPMPVREPKPEVFIKASLNASKQIKKYLDFVEIMNAEHDIQVLDDCVECYYQFETYNFALEGKHIFFLNIAKDLESYLNEETVDREHAENEANEHFYYVSSMTTDTLLEYADFLEIYFQDDVVGQQIIDQLTQTSAQLDLDFQEVLKLAEFAGTDAEEEVEAAEEQIEAEEAEAAVEASVLEEVADDSAAEAVEVDDEAEAIDADAEAEALEADAAAVGADAEAAEEEVEAAPIEEAEVQPETEDASAEESQPEITPAEDINPEDENQEAYDEQDLDKDAEIAAQVEMLYEGKV